MSFDCDGVTYAVLLFSGYEGRDIVVVGLYGRKGTPWIAGHCNGGDPHAPTWNCLS